MRTKKTAKVPELPTSPTPPTHQFKILLQLVDGPEGAKLILAEGMQARDALGQLLMVVEEIRTQIIREDLMKRFLGP